MIPLALITGFLGCGKTTLLRAAARRYAGRRIAYVVNELAQADVDAALLERDIEGVFPLPGGSIFCHCLVSQFIRTLRELPERVPGLDGVLIEASGIANPKVAARMLEETGLHEIYALRRVVAVIDPATFPVLLESLPNIRAQVEASDTIILNKTDLHGEATLVQVERLLEEIRPGAPIRRAQFGEADIDFFAGHPHRAGEGEYAACLDPNYAKAFITLTDEVDIEALDAALDDFGPDLYRAKGFVLHGGAIQHYDRTCAGLCLTPAPGHSGLLGLAVIVRGAREPGLHGLVGRAAGGRYYRT